MTESKSSMVLVGETDARVFELTMKLRRIPKKLEDAGRQLEAEERLLTEVQDPWRNLENEVSEREATIQIALDTVVKFEAHMKLVTTQKEFMAARKQVDEARRLNERLQNEILERRIQQDELSPKLQERRSRYHKVLETYQGEEAVILKDQADMEKELKKEAGKIRKNLEGFGEQAYQYYQRLVQGGKLPAVVAVEGGSCLGCNMALPPQVFNLLLASQGKFFTCPTCSRMVYHQQTVDEPAKDAAAG